MMMKMMAIVLKAIYAEKLEAEGWGWDGVGVLRLWLAAVSVASPLEAG